MTRRHCACPRYPCPREEVTLTARARRPEPPTAYLPHLGSLISKETPAMTQTPTIRRHRLPQTALLPADRCRYPARPLPMPDDAVLARVLLKLRQLPTTGPKDVPPTPQEPETPS
ncbi:hypothetical protein [Amycolatopsis thailandensis]|uniref:hypothetical protein n=1 Tax=Amycolatopsis thailandensis TaxID=589330 RepID=UPI0036395157